LEFSLSNISSISDIDKREFNDDRRDPTEEYFMLAVMANKTIHTEHCEDCDPEYIYEINAKKLF